MPDQDQLHDRPEDTLVYCLHGCDQVIAYEYEPDQTQADPAIVPVVARRFVYQDGTDNLVVECPVCHHRSRLRPRDEAGVL